MVTPELQTGVSSFEQSSGGALLPRATFSSVSAATTQQGDWNEFRVIIYIKKLMDF